MTRTNFSFCRTNKLIMTTTAALLIGINYVQSLIGCHKDVYSLYSMLGSEPFCWSPSTMTVMTDEAHNRNTPLWPSKKNIVNQLKLLTASGAARVVFAFSGHGNYRGSAPPQQYICDVDYDHLFDFELRELLINALPIQTRLLCWMDCCHSGTSTNLRYLMRANRFDRTDDDLFELSDPQPTANQLRPYAVCISGCRDDQVSSDSPDGGVLTSFGVKLLTQQQTWRQFVQQLDKAIQTQNESQMPMLSFDVIESTVDQPISNWLIR